MLHVCNATEVKWSTHPSINLIPFTFDRHYFGPSSLRTVHYESVVLCHIQGRHTSWVVMWHMMQCHILQPGCCSCQCRMLLSSVVIKLVLITMSPHSSHIAVFLCNSLIHLKPWTFWTGDVGIRKHDLCIYRGTSICMIRASNRCMYSQLYMKWLLLFIVLSSFSTAMCSGSRELWWSSVLSQ